MNKFPFVRELLTRIAVLALAMFAVAGALVEFAYADAPKRVALVIGNGDYEFAPKLANPSFDAKAVAAALRRIGFQVTEGYDLSATRMRTTLAEFAASLPDSSAALIYYAGHGVSVDDENYLLPTDIRLKSPTDLDLNAISVSLVLRQLRREERVNVVILDACRNNPFAAELARAKTRSIVGERGLSRVEGELARGSLIAFASDPKSIALDGPPGGHSPFTTALLNHVEDPGVSIDTVMSRVRSDVWEATKNKQLPWVNTSIIGEFELNPAPVSHDASAAAPVAAPASAPDRQTRENLMWESAQHSNLSGDYQAYLEAYPAGAFAQMARNRIAALEAPSAAPAGRTSAEPPPSSPTLRTEVADEAAEQSLNLDLAARKEIQLRLGLLGMGVGAADGLFAEKTRASIRDWQKRHQLEPSGWLGPLQYAALKSESETQYQRFLTTQASIPPATAPPPKVRAPSRTLRKAMATEKKRRLAPQSAGDPKPASATPPSLFSPQEGPCVPGFHTLAFPNRLGYRCIQDGY